MLKILKNFIKQTQVYNLFQDWRTKRSRERAYKNWVKNGRGFPPPHIVKQRALLNYARKYKLKVLVETGTFRGEMIHALKSNFDHIYSIEISDELYNRAKKRFENLHHIELIQGDSGIELKNVIQRINQPILFWLDGHYSGGVTAKGVKDTPVYEELSHILLLKDLRYVIVIDDARVFGTDPAYPTIAELKEFVYSIRDDLDITIQDDSIRITPANQVRLFRIGK